MFVDLMRSPSISIAFEVKPQLENVIVELTAESSLVGILPFSVNDFKSNVLKVKR